MTNVAVENFLLFDALGSVDRILGPSQSVTDRYLYEAFGKEVLKTGTTRNPFRWLGQIDEAPIALRLSNYGRMCEGPDVNLARIVRGKMNESV